jgi:hypothetical protein
MISVTENDWQEEYNLARSNDVSQLFGSRKTNMTVPW